MEPCFSVASSSLSVCESLLPVVVTASLVLEPPPAPPLPESEYATSPPPCSCCCAGSNGGPKRDLRTRGGLVRGVSESASLAPPPSVDDHRLRAGNIERSGVEPPANASCDDDDVFNTDCIRSDICSGRCFNAAFVRTTGRALVRSFEADVDRAVT